MKEEENKMENKEGGNMFGLIKKIIFVFILSLGLMYFFKKEWFDMIINFITSFF